MASEQEPQPRQAAYAGRITVYPGYRGKPDPSEKDLIVDLLQVYQSSEHFNSQVIAKWAEVTQDELVRGGLRTVRAREAAHAGLLRERLRELGETTFLKVPQARHERDIPFFASRGQTDLQKVQVLTRVLADPDSFFQPITDLMDRMSDDRTRELLRTILDDEISTSNWFRRMDALLSERA